MKERPILFGNPMIRAILEGRKSQTRRVVKPQPDDCMVQQGAVYRHPRNIGRYIGNTERAPCPYGVPGDRLWVRETWRQDPGERGVDYRANGKPASINHDEYARWTWRPSIHMPRAVSRITLEIVDVRVERLQEIKEDDAKAEGCSPLVESDGSVTCGRRKTVFRELWDSINAKRAPWASNPFVWVLEFRMTKDAKEWR